jgi:hypothetical protein
MAFKSEHLMEMGQAIGGKLRVWLYVTIHDDFETVAHPGYFPPESQVQTGDCVDVVVTDSYNPRDRLTAKMTSLVISNKARAPL